MEVADAFWSRRCVLKSQLRFENASAAWTSQMRFSHRRCEIDIAAAERSQTLTSAVSSHHIDCYVLVFRENIFQITMPSQCWEMKDILHESLFSRINSTGQGLILLPVDKMAAISKTTVSDAFSWTKRFVFWLKFHRRLFLRVQVTITQHWFR